MSTVYCSYSSINNKRPYLCFLLMIHKPTSTFFLSFITYPIDNWNYFEAICQKWRKFLRIIHKNGKKKYFTHLHYVSDSHMSNYELGQSPDGNFNRPRWNDKNKSTPQFNKTLFYLIEKSVLWFFFPLVLTYILLLLMTWWLNK